MPEKFLNAAIREPYRVLFPTGIAFSFFGLGVWIVYWLWPVSGYPVHSHISIQAKPFILSFVLGFLYTLFPKLFRVPPLGRFSFFLLVILLWGQFLFSLAGTRWVIDFLYLLCISQFILFCVTRFKTKKTAVPSQLYYVAIAFLFNFICSLSITATQMNVNLPVSLVSFSYLFQVQAFVLLIILGVGSFLIPKLMLTPAGIRDHIIQKAGTPTFNFFMGMLIVFSYAIDSNSFGGLQAFQAAASIRLLVFMTILVIAFKIHRMPKKLPQFLKWTWISLWSLPLSQLGIILWPIHRISWDHIFYVNGFILLVLSIASKILSGQAADTGLLNKYPRWIMTYGCILTLGMSTRVTAFFVKSYNMHLGVAAACVLISVTIWSLIYLPETWHIPDYIRQPPQS